jgi:hypothetical protein
MITTELPLDREAMRAAERMFVDLLRAEAEDQHAYVSEWPDGHVSLELEGVNFRRIIRSVIGTYLAGTAAIPTLSRDQVPQLNP